ncbi:MAG: hypothetical protein DU480_13545 [Nitrosomonas sp.]
MSSLLLIGSVWNKIFLMHLIHHEKQRESAILGHPIRVFLWLQLPVLLLGWFRFLLALIGFKRIRRNGRTLDGCHRKYLAASY